ASPAIESVMLAIGFVVIGLLVVAFPGLVGEDAYTGGRYGYVKEILVAVWGVKGGLGSLAIGLVSLGWMYRPWRAAPAGEPQPSGE
ncbi:MAG: hypothetical protein AAFQ43_07460, partial [Bacteroidota bacterium]